MKKLLGFFVCLQLMVLTPAMAQDSEGGGEDEFIKTTQNDILIVAGAAGAGAILGLSTLSFVDQPSKHLRNIYTGAAIGVIGGVIFVAYNSAQRGTEELQSEEEEASIEFNTLERVAWHADQAPDLTLPEVQFGTQIWQMAF